MSDHALFSASDSARWLACTGSLAFTRGMEKKSSEAADEGTAAHTLAAWCLGEGPSDTPHDYLGERIDTGSRTFTVTEEMAGAVKTYVDLVRSLAEGHDLLVEQRVSYAKAIGVEEGQGFGTSDAVILRVDGELIIVDLKYGANPGNRVDAEENTQLQLYALGALEAFSVLGDFDRVRMMICQPRLNHVSEWVQTVGELQAFATQAGFTAGFVKDALGRETLSAKVDLTPGVKQCKWCPGKATCPAMAAEVLETVTGKPAEAADFPDLSSASFGAELTATATTAKALDDHQLSAAMRGIELIESWCKAIRSEVEARLLSGAPVPGYKLVEGRRGARSWSDQDEAESLLKTFRLKVEEMYDLSVISPTTAEKLAKAGTIGPRQWAKAQGLISRSDGKPSVAPESDKRPAISIATTVDDFADLTEECELA